MVLLPDKNVIQNFSHPSWFSIKHFPSFSNTEYNVKSIEKSLEENTTSDFKTLKVRLFPSKTEIQKLKFQMNMFAWYYNACISIFYNNKETLKEIKVGTKFSFTKARDLLYMYKYDYNTSEKFIKRNENEEKGIPLPNGINSKDIHNRLPRGAVKMFINALNASYSLHKGNLEKVNFKFKTKKAGNKNILYFEDDKYPKWINSIKGYYSTSKHKKIDWCNLRSDTKIRNITIQYDDLSNKIFLFWPVDKSVIENQESKFYRPKIIKNNLKKRNIISIDPGIRTFCTVYSSSGDITEICNENQIMYKYHKKVLELRKKLDSGIVVVKKVSKNKKDRQVKKEVVKTSYRNKLIYKKIKKINKIMRNKTDDLHWKSINIIEKLGNTVLYPEFCVQQMLKQENFPDNVKRVMSSLSFYKFKSRLKNALGERVRIVSERRSTKTCCNCGMVDDNVKGKHEYNCNGCKNKINRDWNGAVNILKMNIISYKNKLFRETTVPL